MKRTRQDVAVVTGGSSGIGLESARLLAREGWRVYLVARDQARLQAVAAELPGQVRVLVADLSSVDGARRIERGLEDAGEAAVDLLLNCAGQLEIGPAEALGAEIAERLVQVNYLGSVRAIDVLLPFLRRGQRRSIVNIASLAGRMAPPFMSAYSGSKYALTGYTHALRQELRSEGFHVGLISPGPVQTPMIAGRIHTEHYPVPPGVPIVTPQQVAHEVLRLVHRRRADLVVPRRLGMSARLAAAFPGVVDLLYRWVGARSRPAPADAAPAVEEAPLHAGAEEAARSQAEPLVAVSEAEADSEPRR